MASTTLSFNTSFALCDDAWGPNVPPACRGGANLDFSMLFEESILSIGPICLLLLAAPMRVFQLYRQDKKVIPAKVHDVKLWSICLYGILQVALLGVWAAPWTNKTRVSLANAVFSFFGTLALAALSHIEHVRSITPSVILDAFLFVSLLFDIARARTLWMISGNPVLATLFTVGVVIKAVIVALEAKEKRKILLSAYRSLPPESTSGFYSRSFFWWLNPLFWRGFKQLLTIDDLYPLDDKLDSRYNLSKLEKSWQNANHEGKHALAYASMRAYRWQLFTTTMWKFADTGCALAQPFLINNAVTIVSAPSTKLNRQIGYALIGGTLLLFLTKSITNAQYSHRLYRNLTMLRGGLVTLIYKKTIDVDLTAVKESAAVTLMSTDVERITVSLQFLHAFWMGIFQSCIATYLLQRQIGYACFAPVIFCVVSILIAFRIGKFVGPRQQMWLEATQHRVNVMASMLDSMKGVKALGLTEKMGEYVSSLRETEIQKSRSFRKIQVANILNFNLPVLFGPVVTFTAFVIIAAASKGSLDPAKAFTSLSLINLLILPLSETMFAYPQIKSAIACFGRIQQFLVAESRKDFRIQDLGSPPTISPVTKSLQTRGIVNEIELVSLPSRQSSNEPVINITSGSFGWDQNAEVLHDVNLSIQRGSLNLVVGPVGSGKSTLLKALLGETTSSKGFLHISSSESGFCDQTPWILNGTIQENILGQSTFDVNWYNKVVNACGLADDVKLMQNGDQTIVGSQGITLSGGQKQRISIARTVYARKSVALFDDVFSGLDPPTEKHIFNEVFGERGLLKQTNTTVILATHAFRWLAYSDNIFALSADGRIQEQGRFDTLFANKGYVYSLSLRAHTNNEEVENVATDLNSKLGSRKKAEMAEDLKRKTGDLSIYKYWFKTIGYGHCLLFLVYLAINIVNDKFPVIWLKWWAEASARNPDANNGLYLGVYVSFAVASAIGLALCCWQLLHKMAPISSRKLHKVLLETTMNAPMSFFAATDTGITTNRFSQDLQLVDIILPSTLINASLHISLALAGVILTIASANYVGIVLPLALVFLYGLQKFYLMTSRQLRFLDLEAKSPLYSHFLESLNGVATLRAFGWQAASQQKNIDLLDMGQKPYYLLYCIQRWLTLVLDLFVGALAVLTIALAVSLRGKINGGSLGVALVSIIEMSVTLSSVIQFWTQLETSIGAISRIKKFTSETENENLPEERNEPTGQWPSRASVSFKGMSASYSGSSQDAVLKNISLNIEPGETIGICGRSGSGKSSLVSALFRMINITSGSIAIDGIDISTIPRNTVRSRMIALPQDPFFLNGSVRYNADPTQRSSDKDILESFEKLKLTAAIESAGGLDADFDPKLLSHGQRQLFCLARALLRREPGHPTILVLDEATSAVDAETDDLMQRVVREEFVAQKYTVIAIAHRLDTILDFDKVVVLDKGKLVEYGKPSELLTQEESRFKRLYESRGQEESSSHGSSSSNAR